jgi:hypothetical protein
MAYCTVLLPAVTLRMKGGTIKQRRLEQGQDMRRRQQPNQQENLALLQGIFYTVTGVWPIIHMNSFEAVTGPKVDKWLVKTAGVLVTGIGATLILASMNRRVTPEARLLAIFSALGLTGIDVVYAITGRISKIYLLDAATEVVLATAWMITSKPE